MGKEEDWSINNNKNIIVLSVIIFHVYLGIPMFIYISILLVGIQLEDVQIGRSRQTLKTLAVISEDLVY